MRRCRWGLRLNGHFVLVALLAACALADFIRTPAYAAAEPLVRVISCIGLATMLWHYVIVPSGLLVSWAGWQPRTGGEAG